MSVLREVIDAIETYVVDKLLSTTTDSFGSLASLFYECVDYAATYFKRPSHSIGANADMYPNEHYVNYILRNCASLIPLSALRLSAHRLKVLQAFKVQVDVCKTL